MRLVKDSDTGEAFAVASRCPWEVRDRLILGAVADGLTNEGVAGRIGCSPPTVARRLESIYRTLGARDRANAVHLAHRAGWLW